MVSKILVTGGAGYIGSHTILQLLSSNYSLLVLDNLVNSSVESLKRVCEIANKKIEFVEGDVRESYNQIWCSEIEKRQRIWLICCYQTIQSTIRGYATMSKDNVVQCGDRALFYYP